MKRMSWLVAVAALGAGCPRGGGEGSRRAEVRHLGGPLVQVLPAEGQLPYCLLFSVSEKGVVRQLTMTQQNQSVKCEAGKPLGGVRYRIPVEEGRVRLHVLFSDQRLNAASVGQQLYERAAGGAPLTAMDLRLPGQVFLETLEFSPEEALPTQEGAVVGAGGQAADGGQPGGDGGTP